jgi:hypothetical protein
MPASNFVKAVSWPDEANSSILKLALADDQFALNAHALTADGTRQTLAPQSFHGLF